MNFRKTTAASTAIPAVQTYPLRSVDSIGVQLASYRRTNPHYSKFYFVRHNMRVTLGELLITAPVLETLFRKCREKKDKTLRTDNLGKYFTIGVELTQQVVVCASGSSVPSDASSFPVNTASLFGIHQADTSPFTQESSQLATDEQILILANFVSKTIQAYVFRSSDYTPTNMNSLLQFVRHNMRITLGELLTAANAL
ncbi:MAG: hypothetical protein EZS28_016369, partial [Streblomastix strix]